VRPKRCCAGNCAGAVTSNLPMPYSESPKICQMLPTVLADMPMVPGGGSGATATGQPTANRSDRASGEISLDDRVSNPQSGGGHALRERTNMGSGAPRISSDDLARDRLANGVEIHMPGDRSHIAGFDGVHQHRYVVEGPAV
jgi:hypothetical protein